MDCINEWKRVEIEDKYGRLLDCYNLTLEGGSDATLKGVPVRLGRYGGAVIDLRYSNQKRYKLASRIVVFI